MNIKLLEGANPLIKLLFSGFVVIVVFIITLLLGLLFALPLFGIEAFDFSQLEAQGEITNIAFMKYFQTLLITQLN